MKSAALTFHHPTKELLPLLHSVLCTAASLGFQSATNERGKTRSSPRLSAYTPGVVFMALRDLPLPPSPPPPPPLPLFHSTSLKLACCVQVPDKSCNCRKDNFWRFLLLKTLFKQQEVNSHLRWEHALLFCIVA